MFYIIRLYNEKIYVLYLYKVNYLIDEDKIKSKYN